MGEVTEDDERRYREAVERRDAIKATWEAEGSPLLAEGSVGQLVEHPLLKMLREADLLCDRLAAALRPRRMGRPPTAVIQTTIGPSPAVKLRVVRPRPR